MNNTPEGYVSRQIEIEGDLFQIFERNDPLVIFDVGACEGLDSIVYSRLFKNATVYAFEPRVDNVAKAMENLALFNCQNIHVVQEALSNRIGMATFYLSSGQPGTHTDLETWDYGNKSSSLLAPNLRVIGKAWKWLRFDAKTEVRTNTIENFCREREIPRIDFIHIDVQGAELMVFEGAGNILHGVRAVWTEVSTAAIYKNQPLRWEIECFLRAIGFEIKFISRGYGGQSDELYVRRS